MGFREFVSAVTVKVVAAAVVGALAWAIKPVRARAVATVHGALRVLRRPLQLTIGGLTVLAFTSCIAAFVLVRWPGAPPWWALVGAGLCVAVLSVVAVNTCAPDAGAGSRSGPAYTQDTILGIRWRWSADALDADHQIASFRPSCPIDDTPLKIEGVLGSCMMQCELCGKRHGPWGSKTYDDVRRAVWRDAVGRRNRGEGPGEVARRRR